MFLNFGVVLNAILLVMGGLWCREMFARWRKDLHEYRTTEDASTRHVLIFLWGLTALIALLIVNFVVGILRNVGLL